MLLLAQLAVLFLSTCVGLWMPGEQAILERFGQPAGVLTAGGHLKLPWPIDKVYRYRTERSKTLLRPVSRRIQGKDEQRIILWTISTRQGRDFLWWARRPVRWCKEMMSPMRIRTALAKSPPIGLISVSIPVAIPDHQRDGLELQSGGARGSAGPISRRAR